MAYEINKTNGNAIVVLDGTKNTTATSLTLVGKLSQSYGEVFNENFVRLLENFALGSSPSFPITGQLWYDTASDNIKVFDGSAWYAVGSNIIGNVDLSGNLFVGPNNFLVQDIGGNVTFFNNALDKNIIFKSNVGNLTTTVFTINGTTGRLEVNANANSSFGVTTKIYVDSEIQNSQNGANVALAANIAVVNANLVTRVDTENILSNRIDAANINISLKDTITRVNSINSATDTAITSNISGVYANTGSIATNLNLQVIAASANVLAANVEINNLRANITAANVEIGDLWDAISLTQLDLADYALIDSPNFTGTPTAPTAAANSNNDTIASTAYVTNATTTTARWQGSRRFISTANPTAGDGTDNDFWFKYST